MRMAEAPDRNVPQGSSSSWLADLPTWKKVLLGACALAMIGGAAAYLIADGGTPPPAPVGTDLAAQAPPSQTAEPSTWHDAQTAGAVFRYGLSCFAGFCLGRFLRASFRFATVALGFWLLTTLVLSHFDLVVVNWSALNAIWDRCCATAREEWSSMHTLLLGSLPCAGLGMFGFLAGFKRP